MSESRQLVSAGLILAEEMVLICQRPPGKHLAGLWEFPGGKVKPGESPQQALIREIREELQVEVRIGRPYEIIHYAYEFGSFLVMVFLAEIVEGQPEAIEHSQILWADAEVLSACEFLPANHDLVKKLVEEMPLWFR